MIRLFKIFIPTSTLILLISEIILISLCYVAAGYLFYEQQPLSDFYNAFGALRLAAVVAFIIAALFFNNLYTEVRVSKRFRLLQRFCLIFGLAFLMQSLVDYMHPRWILPKWMMIAGSTLALLTLFAWRMLFTSVNRSSFGFRRFLFLGTSPTLFQVAEYLALHPELGVSPLGYLEEEPGILQAAPARITSLRRLGSVNDLDEVLRSAQPNCVALGMRDSNAITTEKLLTLRFAGVMVEDVPQLYEATFGKVCLSDISLWDMVFSSEFHPEHRSIFSQAPYSTILSLVMIVLLLPVFAVLSLAVKLSSAGPLLMRRKRVGLHQEIFEMLDFRVFRKNSTSEFTPVGKWLHKTGLRGLPRLFNVLRGEMALIGPRAERPEFVDRLRQEIPFYSHRHSVLPGLIGWARINSYEAGRKDPGVNDTGLTDAIETLEYDLYYVKNASVSLNLYILLYGIRGMFSSDGEAEA